MDMIIERSTRYSGLLLRLTSGRVPKSWWTPARCLCHCDTRQQNAIVNDTNSLWRISRGHSYSITSRIVSQNLSPSDGGITIRLFSSASPQSNKEDSDRQKPSEKSGESVPPEKQTIFQKMKQLTKDYWHILIPVHVVTSIGWTCMFYAAAKNGVDIVSIMEYLSLGERYLDLMRGSNAGHWAVTYALYKLATPVRYTVTVGGTTMSIRYLNKMGYLKFKPRSTMKETQSSKCATEPRENYAKTGFKNQQQTEPPKT